VSCGFSTTSIETGIDIVILSLDNGNYAAQPNNRILWTIGSFTHKNDFPDYTVQTTEWNVENKGIRTDNTDKMFYSLDEDAFNGE
jgi:hypothetical protein